MKRFTLLKLRATLLLLLGVFATSAWGEETSISYYFNSKTWDASIGEFKAGDTTGSWKSGKAGNQFTSGQGVQITSAVSGANATSPIEFSNISKIVVKYCTNASKGEGAIAVTVGNGTAISFDIKAPSSNGTTLKTKELTYDTPESGKVNITATCTTNSIYVHSVTIYYSTGTPNPDLTASDLALTGAPVALSFDLGNKMSQTISYTTSSTGNVTVSESDYATFVVDEENKTITVTPTAVTPSAQTITVNQAADATYAAGSATFTVTIDDNSTWELAELSDLTESDEFVIVGNNGSTFAMSNDKGTSNGPTAVAVTIADDKISGKVANNIKWTVSGNATDGYTFYPSGSTETWLYCNNSNDGVRVGTNDNKTFTIDGGYLKHGGTSRYVGIYNSQDWRCYTTNSGNIAGQTFAFYKRVGANAPRTYKVIYDANGATSGNVPTDNTAYVENTSVTVLGNTGNLAKTGYTFAGWNTQADGKGTSYNAGGTFTITAKTTLYAKWTAKTITSLAYTGTPTKTTYYAGQSFDPTGLTVTATYNDESSEDVTSSVIWAPDPLTVGTTSVTGTYKEKTITVNGLTVTEAPGTENKPYTVAEAIAYINTLGDETSPEEVYVSGIISQVDSYNDTYKSITYWISDDGSTTNQMEVYSGKGLNGVDFAAVTDLAVGDIVTVKGKMKMFNSSNSSIPEFVQNNIIVSFDRPAVSAPVISASNVTIEYDATSGEIGYSIANPADGVTLTATTTAEWISNITVTNDKVTFTTTANEGQAARTATITLKYTGAVDKTVTVTQKYFIPDYATLPFAFDGGKASLPTGLTQSGLGSDYTSSPKLKFDGTGDYIILKINEAPGVLKFDIKGNDFSGGTFTVQTSEDGETYTDLGTYTKTDLERTKNEEFDNLDENIRYIKWIYTNKSDGNVGLGNISLAKYVAPTDPTIVLNTNTIEATSAETSGTIEVTYNNITDVVSEVQFCDAGGNAATYDWITASVNNSNNVEYLIEENTTTEARTAYMKVYALDDNAKDVYSELITITQAGIDYTALPFTFNKGKADIETTAGLTQEGLGTDYSTDNTKLKFDTTDDYMILKINDGPSVLFFDIKGNGFSGSTFTVQTSADGKTYNNLKTYTTLEGTTAQTEFFALTSDVRYIKWIYTEKVNGNVGLGNIKVVKAVTATLNAFGYATFASTYPLDFTDDSKFSAWQITGVSGDALNFSQIKGAVAAGTGVLLKGDASATICIPIAATADTDISSTNQLVGITEATPIQAAGEYFGLNGQTFVPVGEGTVPAGKALLPVGVVNGNVKTLNFNFDGTGIEMAEEFNGSKAQSVYDLSGRRVEKPTKGIYIVNGKKVLY